MMSYAAVSLEDMAFPTYQKQKQEVLIFLELQSAEGLEEEYQCQKYQRLNPNSSKAVN